MIKGEIMTDEERAEEYLEKHKECTKLKGVYHLTINEKQAYLDGLAEGRKENEQMKLQIEQMESEIANYNEAIDIMQSQLKDAAGEIELYQRENAELKAKMKKKRNRKFIRWIFIEL